MVAKNKKDPMAWFKINCGELTTETTGLPNEHLGVYVRLLCMYWSSKNSLELTNAQLLRRTLLTEAQQHILDEVLDEFFPLDEAGIRHHLRLDEQLEEITRNSALQSARGKLAHRPKPSLPNTVIAEEDDDQF